MTEVFHEDLWRVNRKTLLVAIANSMQSAEWNGTERFLDSHYELHKGEVWTPQHREDVESLLGQAKEFNDLRVASEKTEKEREQYWPVIDSQTSVAELVPKLARWLMYHYHFYARSSNSPIWRYDPEEGVWKDDGEQLIQQRLTSIQDARFRTHLVNEVLNKVRFQSYDPDVELGGPAESILVENGTIDLYSMDFSEEWDRLEYHTLKVPVKYDENADCPNFKRFLQQVTGCAQDRRALEEFFGYCLYKRYDYAIILMLIGAGENGKSILLSVLKTFLGKENCSSITPQQLERSRFGSAQLYGKLADIAGDIPAKPLKYTGTIKMLTGGDLIHAEHKNRDPFDFVNFAKLIFSANQVPESWDTTRAFYRRFRIIDFPNQFTPKDPDYIPGPVLRAQLTSEEELSGILNLALEGLERLREQGHLTGQPSVEESRKDYLRRSDPAHYFFDQFLKPDPEAPMIVKKRLYKAYTQFAHALGEVPVSKEWFGQKIQTLVPFCDDSRPRVKVDGKEHRPYVWEGIRLDTQKLKKEFQEMDALSEKIVEMIAGLTGLGGLGSQYNPALQDFETPPQNSSIDRIDQLVDHYSSLTYTPSHIDYLKEISTKGEFVPEEGKYQLVDRLTGKGLLKAMRKEEEGESYQITERGKTLLQALPEDLEGP